MNQICSKILVKKIIPFDTYKEIPIKSGLLRDFFLNNNQEIFISWLGNGLNRISSISEKNNTNSTSNDSFFLSDDNKKGCQSAFRKIDQSEMKLKKNQRTSTFTEQQTTSSSRESFFSKNMLNFSGEVRFDQLPCSTSLIDLLIMTLRFKNSSEQLIELVIAKSLSNVNIKFFQLKLNLFNILYQVKF